MAVFAAGKNAPSRDMKKARFLATPTESYASFQATAIERSAQVVAWAAALW
jgi:hypothetical protein